MSMSLLLLLIWQSQVRNQDGRDDDDDIVKVTDPG